MRAFSILLILVIAPTAGQADPFKWFEKEVLPVIPAPLIPFVSTPYTVIKNPKSILERPSSILDPAKPIAEALGLDEPYDEAMDFVEREVGEGLLIVGKTLKNVAEPTAEELANFTDEVLEIQEEFIKNSTEFAVLAADEIYDDTWDIDLGIATIKSNDSLARNLQELVALDQTKFTKLAREGLKISADAIGVSAEIIEEFGLYMSLAGQGFPPFHSNNQSQIARPDVVFVIAPSELQHILLSLDSGPIRYGGQGSSGNKYVDIGQIRVTPMENYNSLLIEAKNATIGWNADDVVLLGELLDVGVKVNKLLLQVVPVVAHRDGSIFLDLYPRIVFLDVKDIAPRLDQYIAHTLQNRVLNSVPLHSIDITGVLQFQIDVYHFDESLPPKRRENDRTYMASDFAIRVNQSGIVLSVEVN